MADDRGAVWTARIRDAKQVLNELRCVSPLSALDASVAQSMQSRENLNCCSKTFDRDARARTHTRRHDVVIARRRG